jgi:ATP-dependent Clp protease ATP-binding subunit ClpA
LSFAGRQFPDKVIDVIDEACVATRMQVINKIKAGNQNEVDTTKLSSSDISKAIVGRDHVAQVSSLSNICMNIDHAMFQCDMFVPLLIEGCEPMDWNSCY